MNFRQMIHEFSCQKINAIVFQWPAHDKEIIRCYSLLIDYFKCQSVLGGNFPEFLGSSKKELSISILRFVESKDPRREKFDEFCNLMAFTLICVSFPDKDYAPRFKIPDACLKE
jgi:hypothetical protein